MADSDAGANWAGNYTYKATHVSYPTDVGQVQDLASSSEQLRAVGSRHSFNGIADSEFEQVSLSRLDPQISVDSAARTVSVTGAVRYGELAKVLDSEGWALHNLASLPHISVVGAVSTGTHGSGDSNGTLATAVRSMDVVTSSGELVTLSAGQADFPGAVVGLGALGVVTRIELGIEPAFEVRQNVFESLGWDVLEAHFDDITGAAYSVSLFTDWAESGVNQVWVKSRTVDDVPPDDFFGARAAAQRRHPLLSMPADNATEQLGITGPWYDRLPHFRLEFTPSAGAEIQSEYLLPRSHAVDAFRAVRSLSRHIAPLLQVSEIRTMKADELWLSGAYGRDTVALHFTWVRDQARVEAVLPLIEEALAPFEARPHWGKVFVSSASEIERLYPKLADFRALATRFDPSGTFRNEFLNDYVFAGRS